MIDEHGNPIDKRNAYQTRALVYVRLIPPGAADTVHFRLHVPEDTADQITLTARLNYRKFSWYNTHFAYAGEPAPAPPGVDPKSSTDPTSTTGSGPSPPTRPTSPGRPRRSPSCRSW